MYCRTRRGRIITHGNKAAAAKEARGIAGSLDECLRGDKTDGACGMAFICQQKQMGDEGKERRDQKGQHARCKAYREFSKPGCTTRLLLYQR